MWNIGKSLTFLSKKHKKWAKSHEFFMFFNKLAPKVSYKKYLVIFSKKHQIQIFPNLIKLSFWKSNIPKFYWSVNDTNPNNTKYVWGPPNTEIFKVFSVFDSTKCSSLSIRHAMAFNECDIFDLQVQIQNWGAHWILVF